MSEPAATGPGALTRDGVFLVTPYAECCRVIETGTGREVARTTGRFPAAYCAWSPDRRWLAVGAHRYGQVRLWEWVPGQTNLQETTVLHGPASWGGLPEFSPDGLRLAVHWGAHLAVYDTSQWRQLWTHPVEDQPFLAQAPDGRLLALRTDKRRIHLFAPGDGTVLATLEMPNGMPVAALAFSPDGSLLVAASAGTGELFVWDLPALHAELTRLGLDWSLLRLGNPPARTPG